MAKKNNIHEVVEEVRKKTTKKEDKKSSNKKTTKNEESSKSSKKNNFKFDKKWLIGIAILIIIIIIFYFLFVPQYAYQINRGRLNYYSNTQTPSESFNQLKASEIVYVSPILEENNASVFFTNAMNLWQVILIGNGIETVQLIRVTENNEFVYCYTNEGDVKGNKQITVEECNQILNNKNNFVVLIEEGERKVILENNKIVVYSSEQYSGQVNFAILKEAFNNAQVILDTVNQKIYGIS